MKVVLAEQWSTMMRRGYSRWLDKKTSKKTLTKAFHHWYYGHLTCFSQEHMQTFGYLTSMLPIVEEMYDSKEEQKKPCKPIQPSSTRNHWDHYCRLPAGLEEAANGEAVFTKPSTDACWFDGSTVGIGVWLLGPNSCTSRIALVFLKADIAEPSISSFGTSWST